MKTSILIIVFATAFTLTATDVPKQKPAAASEPQKKSLPTDQPIPKSSFSIPAKIQEGRDPFFPATEHLFAVKSAPKNQAVPNTGIVFNGISGSKERPFAMINGHTFAEGEEAPVTTSSGRVRVLLVAIKDDHAIIEVAGERRELTFQAK